MRVREFNEDVLYADDQIVKVGWEDIYFLKERSKCNKRKQIRLCTHRDIEDNVHEMIIIHTNGTYVRPHKHLNKSESFHIIKGFADVIFFNEMGNIAEVIPMGNYSSGRKFYHRISDPYYHTLLITSDFLIFHETTKGPFRRSDTVFAPWAPDEHDTTGQRTFMDQLSVNLKSFHKQNINGNYEFP